MPVATMRYRIEAIQTGRRHEDMIRRWNTDPRTRATASRLLNYHAMGVLRVAEEIAREQFHVERDDARRPPASRAHGRHYWESFEKTPNTMDSIENHRTEVINTHPYARGIEKGARDHTMGRKSGGFGAPGGNRDEYIFPESFPHNPATLNQPGAWPANFEDGAGVFYGPGPIQHPGHMGFRIMERARARWHARNR